MSDKAKLECRRYKIGDVYIEEDTLIIDFENKQFQLALSFLDEIVEHAEVKIDKGKYR